MCLACCARADCVPAPGPLRPVQGMGGRRGAVCRKEAAGGKEAGLGKGRAPPTRTAQDRGTGRWLAQAPTRRPLLGTAAEPHTWGARPLICLLTPGRSLTAGPASSRGRGAGLHAAGQREAGWVGRRAHGRLQRRHAAPAERGHRAAGRPAGGLPGRAYHGERGREESTGRRENRNIYMCSPHDHELNTCPAIDPS